MPTWHVPMLSQGTIEGRNGNLQNRIPRNLITGYNTRTLSEHYPSYPESISWTPPIPTSRPSSSLSFLSIFSINMSTIPPQTNLPILLKTLPVFLLQLAVPKCCLPSVPVSVPRHLITTNLHACPCQTFGVHILASYQTKICSPPNLSWRLDDI